MAELIAYRDGENIDLAGCWQRYFNLGSSLISHVPIYFGGRDVRKYSQATMTMDGLALLMK